MASVVGFMGFQIMGGVNIGRKKFRVCEVFDSNENEPLESETIPAAPSNGDPLTTLLIKIT
jgi:hypothetical protein